MEQNHNINGSVIFGVIELNKIKKKQSRFSSKIFNEIGFKSCSEIIGRNSLICFKYLKIKDDKTNFTQDQVSFRGISTIYFGKIYSIADVNYKPNSLNINRAISKNYFKDKTDSLNQLNGNFCGLIFDENKDKVIFFRDPYGLEQIYIYKITITKRINN